VKRQHNEELGKTAESMLKWWLPGYTRRSIRGTVEPCNCEASSWQKLAWWTRFSWATRHSCPPIESWIPRRSNESEFSQITCLCLCKQHCAGNQQTQL